MVHIVIDARLINSSTGRYIERLLDNLELIDLDNKYTVLVRKKDEAYWAPKNDNFTIKVADYTQYTLSEQFGLKNLLEELAPDLIHFCMPQQPILYSGTSITTIHDLTLLNTYNSDKNWFVYHFKQFIGRFVFKRVARHSRVVITPTEYVRSAVVDFANIPAGKIMVTYESADKPIDELISYKSLINESYLMYVGSQSDYKNIRQLILSHQKLIKQYPDLKLVLVGKTSGENGVPAGRNKAWVEKSDFKNVIFTGFIPDEQLAWLYRHTKAYIFPSLMEGFGLPGLEAMSYGAPVVSSSATCLPEIYGSAAMYFDPNNLNDMTTAIEKILIDDVLREELILKGYKQVSKYSWRRMAEQTYQIYLDALK